MKLHAIEDHLCRVCGGRVLRAVHALPPHTTIGYRCADCGKAGFVMAAVCWCGFGHRQQDALVGAYLCLPFSAATGKPAVRLAFLRCGCDPDALGAEVGIVLTHDYKRALAHLMTATTPAGEG